MPHQEPPPALTPEQTPKLTPKRPPAPTPAPTPGAFCWLDLAASDAELARAFYAQAFGWTFSEESALGGRYTRCHAGGRPVGTIYALNRAQLEHGVPSHWTPYIGVGSVRASAQRVVAAGGRLLVPPLEVPGVARIALAQDAVGALFGLWQAAAPGPPDASAPSADVAAK
jgi:predicted enzyme related to lactoylglutathione lyase